MVPRRSIALRSSILLAGPLFAGNVGVVLGEPELLVGELRRPLTVDDGRPYAQAADALMAHFGVNITYEDPRYVFPEDLEDVTRAVRKDLNGAPPTPEQRVIVPRGGVITVHFMPDVESTLERLVQNHPGIGGGRFVVKKVDTYYHLVPTMVRNEEGQWRAQTSVLDAAISLPEKSRTAPELLTDICEAVSVGSPAPVTLGTSGLGMGIVGEEGPPTYLFAATNEPARDVLTRALETITGDVGRLTWRLYYEPGMTTGNSYALNLLSLDRRLP